VGCKQKDVQTILQGGFLLCLPVPRLCASLRPVRRLLRREYEFCDESVSLTADKVRNEAVTIHRSQDVLKMLALYKASHPGDPGSSPSQAMWDLWWTETGFLRVLRFPLPIIPTAPYSSSIIRGWYKRPVDSVSPHPKKLSKILIL
jgi:hypothetical protein